MQSHCTYCLWFKVIVVPVGVTADRIGGIPKWRREEVQNLKRVSVDTRGSQMLCIRSSGYNSSSQGAQIEKLCVTATAPGWNISCSTPDCTWNSSQTLQRSPASQKSWIFSRESDAHTSHLCTAQLLSLLTQQMHMVCLNLWQLNLRLKQILQKRYIPSHSWQPDPKLHSSLLHDPGSCTARQMPSCIWIVCVTQTRVFLYRTAPY